MTIDIDEDNLKHGVLGLTLAIVEVIRDALKLQAIRRMESGRLTEEEIERLGLALEDLDKAIEEIKEEQGVAESVQSVRDGLDDVVNDMLDKIINPGMWAEKSQEMEVRRNERFRAISASGD